MTSFDRSEPAPLPEIAEGPAEALRLTVHEAPPAAADLQAAQGRRGRLMMSLILVACAAPVVLSYLTYFVIRPQARSNYATLIEPQRPLPAIVLHDLDGRPVPAPSLKGQWLLVVVGPSACDAACEKRLFMQRQLREMTGRERDRIDKVWLVEDDAPLTPTLAAAVAATPAVSVLRASRAQIAAWLQPEPGHALEDHLYLVDPLGNWMMRAPPDADPVRLKKDLERLLRAAASWDLPGR